MCAENDPLDSTTVNTKPNIHDVIEVPTVTFNSSSIKNMSFTNEELQPFGTKYLHFQRLKSAWSYGLTSRFSTRCGPFAVTLIQMEHIKVLWLILSVELATGSCLFGAIDMKSKEILIQLKKATKLLNFVWNGVSWQRNTVKNSASTEVLILS